MNGEPTPKSVSKSSLLTSADFKCSNYVYSTAKETLKRLGTQKKNAPLASSMGPWESRSEDAVMESCDKRAETSTIWLHLSFLPTLDIETKEAIQSHETVSLVAGFIGFQLLQSYFPSHFQLHSISPHHCTACLPFHLWNFTPEGHVL